MKIAIPTANGVLCSHFGHCEKFALVEVSEETKEIIETKWLNPPPHEPGTFPPWLAEQGADLIIGGGMGSRAQDLFTAQNIAVVIGAPQEAPEAVIIAYLNGTLVAGGNACDH